MMKKLMTMPVVKTAMKSDEAGVIDALKLAFVADPATRWGWPDPQKYLSHFSSLAKAFGGKAFVHESAITLKTIPERLSGYHQRFNPILTE
jgi:hypothetical protein